TQKQRWWGVRRRFHGDVVSLPDPCLFLNPKAIKNIFKENVMHPIVIVIIPLVLVIAGMVWNSIGLSFDQPASSAEQDPAKRAAAEGDAYRRFFDLQRKGGVERK